MLQANSTDSAVSRASYSANAKGTKATNNFKEFKCSFKQVILLVVLKSTTQVMPGITKWIDDVQVQKQSSVTDFENDNAVCSNMLNVSNDFITPEQCTEQSVLQLPCTSSDQATLQHNGDRPTLLINDCT